MMTVFSEHHRCAEQRYAGRRSRLAPLHKSVKSLKDRHQVMRAANDRYRASMAGHAIRDAGQKAVAKMPAPRICAPGSTTSRQAAPQSPAEIV
jgi:hypothetical protein